MKPAELVTASNELNELLFDPKKKEDGWIDTTGKNIKKMVKGIKEAAEILEADETLTEETLETLRKIDWNLDDYEEDSQKEIQKNLQGLGVWLNEQEEAEEEEEAPVKGKEKTKKKPAPVEEDDDEEDDDEEDEEDEPVKKPAKTVPKKKAISKGDKGTRLDTLCEALKKKPKTFAEWTEKANDLWVSKGGSDSVKESASMSKYVNIITAHFAPDVKFPTK